MYHTQRLIIVLQKVLRHIEVDRMKVTPVHDNATQYNPGVNPSAENLISQT